MQINITTPCVINAVDYHEFFDMRNTLRRLSLQTILYKEFNPKSCPDNQCYAAVFYIRGEVEEANRMIKENE